GFFHACTKVEASESVDADLATAYGLLIQRGLHADRLAETAKDIVVLHGKSCSFQNGGCLVDTLPDHGWNLYVLRPLRDIYAHRTAVLDGPSGRILSCDQAFFNHGGIDGISGVEFQAKRLKFFLRRILAQPGQRGDFHRSMTFGDCE